MSCKPHQLTALVLTTLLLAGGCRDDADTLSGPEPAANGKGLTLLLTDAPGDFLAAVVTIEQIYFQGNGRVVLMDEPYTTDLLTLRDDVATLVQGLEIPAGGYDQLRVVLGGAYIEVETADGSRIYASSPDYDGLPDGVQVHGQLQMPSLGQSGLKVRMPDGRLEIGEGETIILIDFDVQESFGHQAGKSGRWVMHPVVTATDVTFGGNVVARLRLGSNVVIPQVGGEDVTLGDFTATLVSADGGQVREIPLADGDGDGVFEAMFKGLAPGAWTLDFIVPDGLIATFDPDVPRAVSVVARATATEEFVLGAVDLAASVDATLALGTGITLPTVGDTQITLGHFLARLTPAAGGDAIDIAFTDPEGDGTWSAAFRNLPAGDYSLTVVAPTGVSATFDPVPPVAITLPAGAAETRAFVVTAASAT